MAAKVEIKVMGQKFWVTHDRGEDYIQQLARYVNDKIVYLRRSSGAVASYRLALLAAMDIADECFQENERRRQVESLVRDRLNDLVKRLKSRLEEDEEYGEE